MQPILPTWMMHSRKPLESSQESGQKYCLNQDRVITIRTIMMMMNYRPMSQGATLDIMTIIALLRLNTIHTMLTVRLTVGISSHRSPHL